MKFKNLLQSWFAYEPKEHYHFNLTEDSSNNNQNYDPVKNEEITSSKLIFPSLSVNIQYMKTKYNVLINSDIVAREFTINARNKQYHAFLVYIDGMVNSQIMDQFVLQPLMMRNKNNLFDGTQSKVISEAVTNNITVRKVKKFDLSGYILNCLMPQNDVKQVKEFEKIIDGINSRQLCFIC